MNQSINADLCIIGAGSAGLSVAAGAAQLGRNVVLIEKGEMGGDCLNYGCVPSKALLAAAARAQAFRTSQKFGIAPAEPKVDFPAVMAHVREVIDTIAPIDSQERFEGLGVTVLRDHAEFTGERQVKAGATLVDAKHIVIATGSTPFVPPIDGLAETPFLTNETLFENTTLPEHLLVIGGGPIGVEMAQAHARLGARVTLLEGAPTILGKDDPALVSILRDKLIEEGVTILENAAVEKVRRTDAGVAVIAGGNEIAGSHLLVAVGRRPNVEGLNLEAAGVAYDRKGVTVNAYLRTTNRRVYAIGDVAGGRQFTHVAGYHASALVRTILFKAPTKNNEVIAPAVTYSDPELAQVGMTEAKAAEQGPIKTANWPFDENDRAQAERNTIGLVKVVTKPNGEILGASILGPGAGDLIQAWAYAIANKQKIRSFTNMISPYPTRGEANKRAAGAWYTPTLFSPRTRRLVSFLSTFD
ncbi:MAG: FAD-dependent oxidoreductase [Pseudomonadota bacterium]